MKLIFVLRLVGALALGAVVVSCGSDDSQPPREERAAPAASPPAEPAAPPPAAAPAAGKVAYAGELPPLPVSSFPAARPPEVVNAVYEFAARRPDVLRYVPCFCGCERHGHVHNEHCFVGGRESDGTPRWDAHGLG